MRGFKLPVLKPIPRWLAFPSAVVAAEILGESVASHSELLQASEQLLARSCKQGIHGKEISLFDDRHIVDFRNWPEIRGWIGRSPKWLNWRYFDIPEHHYRAYEIPGKSGFAVISLKSIRGHAHKVLRILEWTFAPQDTAEALSMLLNKANGKECIMIECFCTAESLGKELAAKGFINDKRFGKGRVPMKFPSLKSGPGFSMAIDIPMPLENDTYDDWYITAGDMDLDRNKVFR